MMITAIIFLLVVIGPLFLETKRWSHHGTSFYSRMNYEDLVHRHDTDSLYLPVWLCRLYTWLLGAYRFFLEVFGNYLKSKYILKDFLNLKDQVIL